MTRWEFRIVPCLAGGNAPMPQNAGHAFCRCAKCLHIGRHFRHIGRHTCTPEFASAFSAQFKSLVIIIIITVKSGLMKLCNLDRRVKDQNQNSNISICDKS